MELLALAAIIIAAVVALLQIVSMAQIAGIRKMLKAPREERPPQQQQNDRFDKRNQDFRRHDRRPFNDQRPPQQHADTAQVNPVEKSLRDINLRLKSAEREQESARRRIQEGIPRGDQNRGRDDRGRGNNRDRDRNNRRDNRRDSWQDRNRQGGYHQTPAPAAPLQHQPAAPQPQRNEPLFEQQKQQELPAAAVTAPAQQPVQQDLQETIVSDFAADQNLQHGRKIIVKRRELNSGSPEETSAESTSVEETPPRSTAATPLVLKEEETRIGQAPDAGPEGEIKFGRR